MNYLQKFDEKFIEPKERQVHLETDILGNLWVDIKEKVKCPICGTERTIIRIKKEMIGKSFYCGECHKEVRKPLPTSQESERKEL